MNQKIQISTPSSLFAQRSAFPYNCIRDAVNDVRPAAVGIVTLLTTSTLMIQELENLTPAEAQFVLKAPALVAVLAASSEHEMTEDEKAEAIKFTHLKTINPNPILKDYYNEVEKTFKFDFDATSRHYAPFSNEQKDALKAELSSVNAIIVKLKPAFAEALHKSLSGYADHLKKLNRSIFENVLFPFPLPGITD